jgi:hypothetical protein
VLSTSGGNYLADSCEFPAVSAGSPSVSSARRFRCPGRQQERLPRESASSKSIVVRASTHARAANTRSDLTRDARDDRPTSSRVTVLSGDHSTTSPFAQRPWYALSSVYAGESRETE